MRGMAIRDLPATAGRLALARTPVGITRHDFRAHACNRPIRGTFKLDCRQSACLRELAHNHVAPELTLPFVGFDPHHIDFGHTCSADPADLR